MKVLFLDRADPVVFQSLESFGFQCHHYDGTVPVKELIKTYTGLVVRSGTSIDKTLLDAAGSLEFVARLGAGMEHIDTHYAHKKGIAVFSSPEGNKDAVGEHAIGMLLAMMNHIPRAHEQVIKGIWQREKNRGQEIKGKTIGIIGYGNTGSAFAKKLQGFECNVLAYDKYKKGFGRNLVREVGYDQIFHEVDILSLHIPLTPETRYMVNSRYLSNFHKPIWLLNTARGEIVDTQALLESIHNGGVEGASLDVLEFESPSFCELDFNRLPQAFQDLCCTGKVLLTPHIAGWTQESKYKLGKVLADKILSHYKLKRPSGLP